MRLKLIACKALYREISYLSAVSDNFIDVTYIRQGFHETPKILTKVLQEEIDHVESGDDRYTYRSYIGHRDFDAILLGYGLCSNGVLTLHSERIPLVIPKAHDCITLFLGSRERYDEEFSKNPGTYWYNPSWIENANVPSAENAEDIIAGYAERYGEENAEFLYETEMLHNYSRCAYINWPELPCPKYEKFTEDAAEYLGWEYSLVNGSSALMKDFLDGSWDDRFLIVHPGETVAADYDGDEVIKAVPYKKEDAE